MMTACRFFEGGKLPDSYEDAQTGKTVVFKTDFRNWLKYEYLCSCHNLAQSEKVVAIIATCVASSAVENPLDVLEGAAWFSSCGDMERTARLEIHERALSRMQSQKKTLCLFWDFWQVWASFKQQHGIDLYTCGTLHWWEFKRLLGQLAADSPVAALRQTREMSRAMFMQDDKGLAREKEKLWALIELEKIFKALPED